MTLIATWSVEENDDNEGMSGWDDDFTTLSIEAVKIHRPGDCPLGDKRTCDRKEWLQQYILHIEKEIVKLGFSIARQQREQGHPRYVRFDGHDDSLINDTYEKKGLEASLPIAKRLLTNWLS